MNFDSIVEIVNNFFTSIEEIVARFMAFVSNLAPRA